MKSYNWQAFCNVCFAFHCFLVVGATPGEVAWSYSFPRSRPANFEQVRAASAPGTADNVSAGAVETHQPTPHSEGDSGGRQSLGSRKAAKHVHSASEFLSRKLEQKVAKANPDFHHTLYKPEGVAQGSVILLPPWGGRDNWWVDWLGKKFAALTETYRVVEAVGREMVQPNATYTAWYGYEDWESELPVAADLDAAVAYVHSLVEQEYRILQDYRRIVLVGYSQGAVLALESGLRFPHALGFVFSQRGILLQSRKDHCKGLAPTPYILTAGADDNVYPDYDVQWDSKLLRDGKLESFFVEIEELDHYRRSEKENSLVMQSVAVELSNAPPNSLARVCHDV